MAFIVKDVGEYILPEVVSAYIDSFAGPPWFETCWSEESVEKILVDAFAQEGFAGQAVFHDDLVVGACFGYKVPKEDTPTVNFSAIDAMLENVGWNNSFYLAKVFMRQRYQGYGAERVCLDFSQLGMVRALLCLEQLIQI